MRHKKEDPRQRQQKGLCEWCGNGFDSDSDGATHFEGCECEWCNENPKWLKDLMFCSQECQWHYIEMTGSYKTTYYPQDTVCFIIQLSKRMTKAKAFVKNYTDSTGKKLEPLISRAWGMKMVYSGWTEGPAELDENNSIAISLKFIREQ